MPKIGTKRSEMQNLASIELILKSMLILFSFLINVESIFYANYTICNENKLENPKLKHFCTICINVNE